MCANCTDLLRTTSLIDSLSSYAEQDDADQEFVDVTAYALNASLLLALGPAVYPPAGHTFPKAG